MMFVIFLLRFIIYIPFNMLLKTLLKPSTDKTKGRRLTFIMRICIDGLIYALSDKLLHIYARRPCRLYWKQFMFQVSIEDMPDWMPNACSYHLKRVGNGKANEGRKKKLIIPVFSLTQQHFFLCSDIMIDKID